MNKKIISLGVVALMLTFFIISVSVVLAQSTSTLIFRTGATLNPDSFLPSYFCQYGRTNNKGVVTSRSSWNYNYGTFNSSYCDIYGSGCSMAALAMIMTYFGDRTTPSEASQQNGHLGCASPGTLTSQIDFIVSPKLRAKGYIITPNLVNRASNSTGGYTGTIDLTDLKKRLDHGFLLWGGAKIAYATRTGLSNPAGHAFVITDIDAQSGKMTIYDPTFCQDGNSLNGGKRVIDNVNSLSSPFGCETSSSGSRTCGWIQVYAVKK